MKDLLILFSAVPLCSTSACSDATNVEANDVEV